LDGAVAARWGLEQERRAPDDDVAPVDRVGRGDVTTDALGMGHMR
jgi:hypothetical protein